MAAALVRWATRWDGKALSEMVCELARQHGVQTSRETVTRSFEYALRCPDRLRYCVAQQDKQLVGVACLADGYSSWRAAPYGIVHDFYVAPAARRSGVGSELMELLMYEARRRGYCRLELEVRSDNEGALGFYSSRDFEPTGYVVYSFDLEETESPR